MIMGSTCAPHTPRGGLPLFNLLRRTLSAELFPHVVPHTETQASSVSPHPPHGLRHAAAMPHTYLTGTSELAGMAGASCSGAAAACCSCSSCTTRKSQSKKVPGSMHGTNMRRTGQGLLHHLL